MDKKHVKINDELIVDSFAGGGGTSTGIELATGRIVDIAINHDAAAILMHRTNHPHTVHYQASVWDINPEEVCTGRSVGLAWFSPDCKHFSRAKGGKPKDKTIRGLAWIALRWAGTVRPRVIILENVVEFQDWGPLNRGHKPIQAKKGETFRRFVGQLRVLGYTVEWRELTAADFGAPTTRRRFFLIARCDGRPVVWPEPTHAPRGSEEVKAGKKKLWRSAGEIIDWSLPCPSIFDSKQDIRSKYGLSAQRPLAENTLRRVARGLDKFVIRAGSPFLVAVNHSGDFRGQGLDGPLKTITAKHGYGVVSPVMTAIGQTGGGDRSRSVLEPTHTQVSKAEECVVTANLIQYHSEQTEFVRGQGLESPIMTVDAANRYALTAACLTKYYSGDHHGQDINAPLHTVTSKDREGVLAANLVKFYRGVVGASVTEPTPTITAIDHNALTVAHMMEMYGTSVGKGLSEPVGTVTASGAHHAIVSTSVVPADGGIDLGNWPEIRNLLNRYCGYNLKDYELLLLQIDGGWWFIRDIGLRMLTPRELYRANGFPEDYIIDRDYTGKEYKKAAQVARCGNAVPPPFATALVRANLPEWCGQEIRTMAELERMVAG